jgi:hypothetical protein
MTNEQRRFVWAMVAIIGIILAIALYGYLSGAWTETPA